MGKRKPAAESTISFNITLPTRLAKRLDAELAKVKKLSPFMVISRSAIIAHALGEWVSLLSDPTTEPTLPVRERVRSPRRPPRRRKAQLTHDQVRNIRADGRPLRNIARDMKINISTVSRVKAGKSWASVE